MTLVLVFLSVGMYLMEQMNPKELPEDISELTGKLEYMLPQSESGNQVVEHFGYTLAYDEQSEQAEWVAYMLTNDQVPGLVKRNDNFREDPAVATGSATLQDYKGSGYDRGHLAPAGDMKWDKKAMSESFYMSNMSPQEHSFNGGVWRVLEEQIREWAVDEQKLFIVTGPVPGKTKGTIGRSKVAVPAAYFKVVLDVSMPEYNAIGFVMKNEKTKKSPDAFAVTVDEVEELTGIDFFPALPDTLEAELESTLELENWSFK